MIEDLQKAYTIKEFSDLTGVPQNTLRNWEEKLEEAFYVPRDPAKNRYYTDKHAKIVNLIQKWRDSKYEFSLSQIKEMLLKLQEEGQLTDYYPSTQDGGEGSSSVVSVSQHSGNPSTGLQLQQMQQLVVSMEERMQQFFGQLDHVLQRHADNTQSFIKGEIEALKQEQEARDDQYIQNIEMKFQQKFETESKIIQNNVNSIKEELRIGLDSSKSGLQEQLEKYLDDARSELQKQLEDNMNKWAVISRDELDASQKKKKRGFLGLFGSRE
ncbi:helix-turn-helix domain-containing protein [Bacillus cereus]|nr:helix-turn-helix domain-containing protein [Bacillus cereus]